MRRLLLSPDFPDHVLWEFSEKGGPVLPESLSISGEMRVRLRELYKLWSDIYMADDYRVDSTSRVDWLLFDLRGIEVWKQLRRELANQCEVLFYSYRLSERFQDPETLERMLKSEHIA